MTRVEEFGVSMVPDLGSTEHIRRIANRALVIGRSALEAVPDSDPQGLTQRKHPGISVVLVGAVRDALRDPELANRISVEAFAADLAPVAREIRQSDRLLTISGAEWGGKRGGKRFAAPGQVPYRSNVFLTFDEESQHYLAGIARQVRDAAVANGLPEDVVRLDANHISCLEVNREITAVPRAERDVILGALREGVQEMGSSIHLGGLMIQDGDGQPLPGIGTNFNLGPQDS